jgi:rubrerythrin
MIVILAAAIIIWAWRRGVAKRLRGKLIEMGVPVCRKCGHLLRGLSEARCPECGWEVDEAVRAITGL